MEINLEVGPLLNTKRISSFSCGIEEMDDFVHTDLQNSINGHYCKAYAVYEGHSDDVIAFFALNYDSLELTEIEKWDALYPRSGSCHLPLDVSIDYESLFKNKQSYPALEISYLAVRKDMQYKKIGTRIISEIHKMIKDRAIAGCQFLTVMAYKSTSYSAVGFYRKCGFRVVNGGGSNTERMYSPLYTLSE